MPVMQRITKINSPLIICPLLLGVVMGALFNRYVIHYEFEGGNLSPREGVYDVEEVIIGGICGAAAMFILILVVAYMSDIKQLICGGHDESTETVNHQLAQENAELRAQMEGDSKLAEARAAEIARQRAQLTSQQRAIAALADVPDGYGAGDSANGQSYRSEGGAPISGGLRSPRRSYGSLER